MGRFMLAAPETGSITSAVRFSVGTIQRGIPGIAHVCPDGRRRNSELEFSEKDNPDGVQQPKQVAHDVPPTVDFRRSWGLTGPVSMANREGAGFSRWNWTKYFFSGCGEIWLLRR
jgi:hypothetical protein